MEKQNYKNHARLVPGYHFLCTVLGLLLLIGSIVNVVTSSKENFYSASLLVLMSIFVILIAYFARSFALRAQDRVIQSEVNFRYYRMTGEMLDSRLTIRQVIGLRFASNDEFLELCGRAIDQKLSEKAIKEAIVDWEGDYYRV